MYRLVRWLAGYINFSFKDGFSEGFINDCYELKYNVFNIKEEGEALYASCPEELFPLLKKTAEKNGGVIKKEKRGGLPLYLDFLKNRAGLMLGALFCVILINFSGGFIWEIDVSGNEKISKSEVLSFLEENGFYEGVYKKSVDFDRLENLMLASFDGISWAHINEQGTTALVEINEAVARPKTVSRRVYYNLKAKKDGIIVKATVYDGWQAAKKGDAVVKGDLLISGIYESEKKKINLFTHARGEYIAEVKEPVSIKISRNQKRKSYLDEKKYVSVSFFGLKIPLYIRGRETEYESSVNCSYLKLNGKKLPIGLITERVLPYRTETVTLSDSELSKLCEKELSKRLKEDFGSYEIIKKKLDTALKSDCAEITGYVLCLEDIGKEVKIKVKSVEREKNM